MKGQPCPSGNPGQGLVPFFPLLIPWGREGAAHSPWVCLAQTHPEGSESLGRGWAQESAFDKLLTQQGLECLLIGPSKGRGRIIGRGLWAEGVVRGVLGVEK